METHVSQESALRDTHGHRANGDRGGAPTPVGLQIRGSVMSVLTASPSASEEDLRPTNRSLRAVENTVDDSFTNVPVLIDTIRVRGRIKSDVLPIQTFRQITDLATGATHDRPVSAFGVLIGPEVRLQVDHHHGRMDAYFEMSVPKALTGSNLFASTVPETLALLNDLYAEAGQWVEWGVDATELTIARLDLVRDFTDIDNISSLLDGLHAVPTTASTVSHRFTDSKRGGAETLRRDTKKWAATVYDKHAETRSQASKARGTYPRERLLREAQRAQGRLRYELMLRSDPLRAGGVRTVSDLAEEGSLGALRLKYFRKVGYDQGVGGMTKIDRVLRQMMLDPKDNKMADKMLGILHRESLGLPQVASDKTLREHRALARRYGVSAADLTLPDRPTIALDYESGTLRKVA